jgi:uncharacterized protein YjbI with pentapeptide repeats
LKHLRKKIQFEGTKFEGTKFEGTKFEGTKFEGTKFEGTKFEGKEEFKRSVCRMIDLVLSVAVG